MDEVEIFLRLGFMGLAVILAALTFASWFRAREIKLLLAAGGFGILAAEGVLMALGIFSDGIEEYNSLTMAAALNFTALVFLYLSVLKR